MSRSTNLDKAVKAELLLSHANSTDQAPTTSPVALAASLKQTFLSEYEWRVEQVGLQNAVADWLEGLPSALCLPFYYDDILTFARHTGGLSDTATKAKERQIIANYYNFMAAKICQLFSGYRIPKADFVDSYAVCEWDDR